VIDRCDCEGVREVVAQLEKLQIEADQRHPLYLHDGVACFNYLYTVITRNVLRCVEDANLEEGDPEFHDPAFMACLDVAFANRYLAAMGAGEPPPFQPRCWEELVRHRETGDISPLMFAIAGVNAHVNFDLPFALVTACERMACELESGSNHGDYQLINDIFALHMQQLRQHFESRFERGFDRALVSKVENVLGDIIVVVARDAAWLTAKRLWRVHTDGAQMLRRAQSRDRWVARVNWGLFQLDRVPAVAFRGLHRLPGPLRGMGSRGLGRTSGGVAGGGTSPPALTLS
jgi:hypothetical protein